MLLKKAYQYIDICNIWNEVLFSYLAEFTDVIFVVDQHSHGQLPSLFPGALTQQGVVSLGHIGLHTCNTAHEPCGLIPWHNGQQDLKQCKIIVLML